MKGRLFFAALCTLLSASTVFAAEAKKEAVNAPDQAAPAKPLSPEDQIRAQLEGTEWTIQLNPSSGSKAVAQKDTITFTKKQVKSSFMEKTGYPASNYSLTLGGDGRAVWETMQTKEGEGVAFWRGELEGATMRGVLSKHPTEGPSEDYSVSGHSVGEKKIVIPGAQAAAAGAVQAQPAHLEAAQAASAAATQAQQALAPTASAAPAAPKPTATQPKKKKKRGWF